MESLENLPAVPATPVVPPVAPEVVAPVIPPAAPPAAPVVPPVVPPVVSPAAPMVDPVQAMMAELLAALKPPAAPVTPPAAPVTTPEAPAAPLEPKLSRKDIADKLEDLQHHLVLTQHAVPAELVPLIPRSGAAEFLAGPVYAKLKAAYQATPAVPPVAPARTDPDSTPAKPLTQAPAKKWEELGAAEFSVFKGMF